MQEFRHAICRFNDTLHIILPFGIEGFLVFTDEDVPEGFYLAQWFLQIVRSNMGKVFKICIGSFQIGQCPVESLFRQLADASLEWRAYEQGIPSGCFTGSSARAAPDGPGAAGAYARKHDPAISFTSVSGNAAQCADIQPLRAFDPVKGAFAFITPNLINDMHDGSVAQGDAFLRDVVPLITASPAFATGVLFITFDEGSSNAGSHGDGGGHIATLIVAPRIRAGTRVATYTDHFSLLRTTQELLGLPCLAKSCERTAITY